MNTLNLIIPVYRITDPIITGVALMYPETEKTPKEQIEFLKEWWEKNKTVTDVTIVTVSPYIAEAALKIFTHEKAVYSDGKWYNIHPDGFFKHFARPMMELFFEDKIS